MRQELKLQTQKNKLNMSTNNFGEDWMKWEPISGLAQRYYLDEIVSNSNGFRIILIDSENEKSKVEVFFKDSVWAYRCTDENFSELLQYNLYVKYNDAFYTGWTFFKVKKSYYLDWLSAQSRKTRSVTGLTHFAIFCEEDFIDIAASYEPEVTFFVENNNMNKN